VEPFAAKFGKDNLQQEGAEHKAQKPWFLSQPAKHVEFLEI
jgi:hypothetical protein